MAIDCSERRETSDVWLGVFPSEAEFFDLVGESENEALDEDDDRPLSRFIEAHGQLWYDHDQMEAGYDDSKRSLREFLRPFSYSDQYVDELEKAALRVGLESANAFLMFTRGQVKAPRSIEAESYRLVYVGAFTYRI